MDRFAPNYQQLKIRFGLSFSLLGLVVVGFIAAGWAINARTQTLASMETSTRELVSLAALHIDGDALSQIRSRSDEGSQSYIDLLAALDTIRNSANSMDGVYVLKVSHNGQITIAAASTPKMIHHVGDPFPVEPAISASFSNMDEPLVETNVRDVNLRGMWGYSPILNKQGTMVGALAVRLDVSGVNQQILRQGMLLSLIFLVGVGLIGVMGWMSGRRIATPLQVMSETVARVNAGDVTRRVPIFTDDEIGDLGSSINAMLEKTQNLVGEFEQKIITTGYEIEERDKYLHAAARVAQAATGELNESQLANQAAEYLLEGFQFQNVGLFMQEEERWELSLLAGAGEAMRSLAKKGVHLPSYEGLVASCISSGRARASLDQAKGEFSSLIPELPAARAEAVAPLRARGQVIGVVMCQSDRIDAFSSEALAALQTTADQIAVALDNARLLTQNREALQRVNQAYSELSRKAWQELLRTRTGLTASCDENGVRVDRDTSAESFSSTDPLLPMINLPIQVRGQVIGKFKAHKAQNQDWSKDELGLLDTLMEQLSIALESARLYNDSQMRAERERMAGEITARMRETLEIDTILQTAAREMRRALDLSEVEVRMGSPKFTDGNGHPTQEPFSTELPKEA